MEAAAPVKMSKQFLEDFTLCLSTIQSLWPHQWPEEEKEALVEEAKQAVRRDPEGATLCYGEMARSIRETGYP